MTAGTAECLPMAQLFANLSLLPPTGLQCTLPAPLALPLPSALLLKNNSDLIPPSPPLPAANANATQDMAV